MSRSDRRPVIFRNALANPDLGNVERLFLITLVHLPTEYVDGVRRSGSRGMDAGGKFSLHYDYIACAMHTSPENVKKLAQRLEAKGYLSKRWRGTYGRPAGFEALDVRGDMTYPITFRPFVPPYEVQAPPTRRDTTSPLPCSRPTHPDHAPTSRAVRPAGTEVEKRSNGEQVPGEALPEPPAWMDDYPLEEPYTDTEQRESA
ncbi:hypothetical protein JOE61_000359 [Nocardioides salarius]|uniref:Uncharacterized protein n=1 Tax=Nocardioides salarius TaxID=374513 RepID=A0ABS2M5S2_9ACTN|nr:hypothetical protein [Nocardioides salarius]MBM7506545.1 hypothetical protein [Nocardioides salarius]